MQIKTLSISETVASTVREFIVDGSLPDGERINEVHLADQLGVSRTPLREGLGQLMADGVITKAPRRGFFVVPMTLEEFNQLYAIRPLLDPEALRLAGLPDERCLDRLEAINRKMISARTAGKAIDLDNAWHITLLAACPNRVLMEFIEQLIARTRRYEHGLFRETRHVWAAGDEHDQIVAVLRDNDLKAACRMLRRNMQSGSEPIIEWLANRDAGHDS